MNSPNDAELEKLIKNEINDDLARRFKYFGDNDSVLNALSTMISNWMKDKRGRFLSPEEGGKFFKEFKQFPKTLSAIEREVKEGNKGINEVKREVAKLKQEIKKLHYEGNEQRPRKKPYASRDKKSKAKEEGDIGELDEFDEIEALEFVKRALNIENNLQNKEIKKLTHELQYSRLALKLAVIYISEENIVFSRRGRKRIRVGGYLRKCKKKAEKLLNFESEYKSDRFAKATSIAWKITIDAIMQKKFGPEALSILEMMAYFAPDEIYIEDIFSRQIADDKEGLWNPIELLDRYSMINLQKGLVNVYRLGVQSQRVMVYYHHHLRSHYGTDITWVRQNNRGNS